MSTILGDAVTIDKQTNAASLRGLIDRSITSIVVPSGTTTIGEYAFSNCNSLASVSLPEGLQHIRVAAFNGCRNLTEISFPASIIQLQTIAFNSCSGLQKITFKSATPPILQTASVFTSLPSTCIVYVPYSADHSILNNYKSATNYPDPSLYTYLEEATT